jgi:hypothetical protein
LSRPGSQSTLTRRARRPSWRRTPGRQPCGRHGGGRVPRDAAAEQPAAGAVDADGEGEQRGPDGRVEVDGRQGHGSVELVAQAGDEGHRVLSGCVERRAGCEDTRRRHDGGEQAQEDPRHEFFAIESGDWIT